jgi:stage III sporulation protein SpoIIIAA
MTRDEQPIDDRHSTSVPDTAQASSTPNGTGTGAALSLDANSKHFQGITDNLEALLAALPDEIRNALIEISPEVDAASEANSSTSEPADNDASGTLLEVVLDLGRVPWARYLNREVQLSQAATTQQQLDTIVANLGDFGDDNRAGIDGTLHRISCIRNRHNDVVGLTMRVGRAVYGTVRVIEDLVNSGTSILLLGRPGVGKTTMLREVARVLSESGKRVIVVDTSNEIAGDGDIPHPGIGRARRMQVRTPSLQHAVMVEAVENHMPEVIVIDEIGTELEAQAARTIAERGVQLVATAHGNTLANLMMNPTLADLIGGIQTVTLSDEEARHRGTRKSVLERKAPPTFGILIEIQSFSRVSIHTDVARTVDSLLRGNTVNPSSRQLDAGGQIQTGDAESVQTILPFQRDELRSADSSDEPSFEQAFDRGSTVEATPQPARGPHRRLFPFGVSPARLDDAISAGTANVSIVNRLEDADAVMTLRSIFRRHPAQLRDAESAGLPIYVLKHNTVAQMEQSLLAMGSGRSEHDQVTTALAETEDAIAQIHGGDHRSVDLTPQNAYIRRLQHQLAERMDVFSNSKGRDPHRRVRLFKT